MLNESTTNKKFYNVKVEIDFVSRLSVGATYCMNQRRRAGKLKILVDVVASLPSLIHAQPIEVANLPSGA